MRMHMLRWLLVLEPVLAFTLIGGRVPIDTTAGSIESAIVYVPVGTTAASFATTSATAAAPAVTTYCLGAPISGAVGSFSCACDATKNAATWATNTITETLTATAWGSLEGENPRPLCAGAGATATFTGVFIQAAFRCNADSECQSRVVPASLSTLQAAAFSTSGKCTSQSTSVAGVCYNSHVASSCGSVPYTPATMKCCTTASGVTTPVLVALDENCPCSTSADCPTGTACCLKSKYTEHANTTITGKCYSSATQACCDTGDIYNPGSDQCCPINGVQARDTPCPCATNTDCSADPTSPLRCCQQTSPVPEEPAWCSKYQNFPSGTASAQIQRCPGVCIDSRYQLCCNGVACVKEYERCCNTTCCNKFFGACHTGRRSAAAGMRFNPQDLDTTFEQCSVIEQMSPLKAFWIFLLPTFLMLGALLSLALVLLFAAKDSARTFSLLEKSLIALSVAVLLLSIPLYFSPLYKYGIACTAAALVSILCAAALSKRFNFFVVCIVGLVLLYLVDPFHGSQLMTFGSLRGSAGMTDRWGAGLVHTAVKVYSDEMMFQKTANPSANLLKGAWCTQFYDYFRLDPMMLDVERWDNPEVTTFGYCSRGWTIALLFFSALLIALVGLLFVLALLGLVSRFSKTAPVELEVVLDNTVTQVS